MPFPAPLNAGGGNAGRVPVVRWVMSDAVGSGVVEVDVNGDLVRQTRFKPFGGVDAETYPSPRRFYAGHPEQPETELMYMRARWMDPVTGTFLSVDPVVPAYDDPQSLNAYAYARNNPVSYIDPTGSSWLDFPTESPGWTPGGYTSDGIPIMVYTGSGMGDGFGGGPSGPAGGFGDTSFLGVDVGLANSLTGLGAIGGTGGASPPSGPPPSGSGPQNGNQDQARNCPGCHYGHDSDPFQESSPGVDEFAQNNRWVLPSLIVGGVLGRGLGAADDVIDWVHVSPAEKAAVNRLMNEFGRAGPGARRLREAVERGARPLPRGVQRSSLRSYQRAIQKQREALKKSHPNKDLQVMDDRLEIYRRWLGD